MSKANIYKALFDTKTLVIKEFITEFTTTHDDQSNVKPYIVNFSKTLTSPELFDNITLQIENLIQIKNIKYDCICAASIDALPYATNVSTSIGKPISYIKDTGNNSHIQGDIKNLKIEGNLVRDNNVLLIETISENNFHLENVIAKIRKYGGIITAVIIILNKCEGEFCNLLKNNENVLTVINLFDIFNHLENNNMVENFYSEKIKFYCEKEYKNNIQQNITK